MPIPENVKDRGALAEMLLAVELKKREHTILLSAGENTAFDLVALNKNGRFFRIQVKSCLKKDQERERHTFTLKRGTSKTRRVYSEDQVDVLALHTFDTDEWFLVPMNACLGIQTLKIDENSRYYKYKDNWGAFD